MKKTMLMGALLLAVAAFSAQAQTPNPTNGVNSATPGNGVRGTITDSTSTDSSASLNSSSNSQNQSGRRRTMNSSSGQSGSGSSGSGGQGNSRKMKRNSTNKATNPQ